MKTESRPWGTFTILDEDTNYKVKRIEVLAGKRLSYQKHASRSEHWTVVRGQGRLTLDGRQMSLETGQSTDIAVGVAHRD